MERDACEFSLKKLIQEASSISPLSERKNNSNCNLMTYLIAKSLYLVFWDGLVVV